MLQFIIKLYILIEFSTCDNLKHQKRCLEVLFFLRVHLLCLRHPWYVHFTAYAFSCIFIIENHWLFFSCTFTTIINSFINFIEMTAGWVITVWDSCKFSKTANARHKDNTGRGWEWTFILQVKHVFLYVVLLVSDLLA